MQPVKKYIQIANGEKLAYLDEGKGEVLLLIHGNMSSSMHFLPLFSRLKGYRLIAPDLRGFGDSTYNSQFSSLKELADDVKSFADALKIPAAHVVGWSTGGGIALELAAKYPDFVKTIFAIEGAGHKGYPIFKKNADGSSTAQPYASKAEMAADPVQVAPCLAAFAAKNVGFFEYIWNLTIYPLKKPEKADSNLWLAETLKQRCLTDLDWALAAFNMSAVPNAYRSGDNTIGHVKCPCAFTSGSQDFVVPPAMVAENMTAVANSKLITYENCGHSPLVDCPDRLAADIIAHIA